MLYINYGVPKSGSTLTFEMTWRLLNLAGHKQFALPAEIRNDPNGREHYTNTIRHWSPSVVSALEGASPTDTILLLRTHYTATDAVADLITRGAAKHMVGLRDPRDIALSMLDVVTRLGHIGKKHGHINRGELESTLHTMDLNVLHSTAWADIPGALLLDYEQTAFSHERTLDAISEQLGLPPSQHLYPQVFESATDRMEVKKNVARPYRHRREMRPEDQEMFLQRYADYYARFFPDAAVVVEEDDESERVAVAKRQMLHQQRAVERKARKDGWVDKQFDSARTELRRNRRAESGVSEGATKEERRRQRDESQRLKKVEGTTDRNAAKELRRQERDGQRQSSGHPKSDAAKAQRRLENDAKKRVKNEQRSDRQEKHAQKRLAAKGAGDSAQKGSAEDAGSST